MRSTQTLDVGAGPVVTEDQVGILLRYLSGKGWVFARKIKVDLGLHDRRVRAIAEHSDGRILSGPGCPGYRLFTREALPDADVAASRLESQANRMRARAVAIRRRFHLFGRPDRPSGPPQDMLPL